MRGKVTTPTDVVGRQLCQPSTRRDTAPHKKGRRPKTSEPLFGVLAWGGDQRRRCQHVCLLNCRPVRNPLLVAVPCAAIPLQVAAQPRTVPTSVATASVSAVPAPCLRRAVPTAPAPSLAQRTSLDLTSMLSAGAQIVAWRWRGAAHADARTRSDQARVVVGAGGGRAQYRLHQRGTFVDADRLIAWLTDDLEGSLPWIERANAPNLNYAQARYSTGWAEAHLGSTNASQHNIDAALRQSPLDPVVYGMLGVRALSHPTLDDRVQAAHWAERAANTPGAPSTDRNDRGCGSRPER